MSGPLDGLRVLELAGIGPGPHAAMMLADLGADVVRVDRPGGLRLTPPGVNDHLLRGRQYVDADLKSADGVALVLSLAESADVLIEGYRPGVAERLGVGPRDCLERNPALVYARMTGWGQDGPWAQRAGHDLNYISVTGVLGAIGGGAPVVPLNLIGDFGGGSMFLVVGILAALVERSRSGQGQVIDAAMVDGVAVLSQFVWALRAAGQWSDAPGTNLLDGGSPFYDCYRCADGRYVAVGALEPAFYAALISGLGLDPATLPDREDPSQWPALRAVFTATFAGRTAREWAAVFEGTDACVTPVLTLDEAAEHPQVAARGSVLSWDGVVQAGTAPRFSRTPGTPGVCGPADTRPVVSAEQVLRRWR
ncbi:MAG: CoA transferase [Austwickia sp.]|nr:CoA transferase [Austwickia sp.]MBK8437627.1 CoA transferase [Austwickia sp.]MBK9102925.1 CoA transferase [Austwickia sp.]